ncbi:hypothetical protein [Sciscionella marina]|uniref:hypothetical protein n=1 Tax=Sciscionella marina TaxID=508770 RepID=UPI00146DAE04|nr:hypothetical protein [Sciscionella marina]
MSGQGHSMAAAMLRLARAVTRRALRALEAVHGLDIAVLDYVGMLPRLLDNLADTLDLDDQSAIPVGLCAEPAHRR